MLRFARWPAASLLMATACGGTTFRWQPSLVSQVPDGTPVRYIVRSPNARVQGIAFGWMRDEPRIVTPRGDTVAAPPAARLEVRLPNRTGHATAGGIVGLVVGMAALYARCDGASNYCGEQDPTPLLTAGVGALVGSAIRTAHWVRVRRAGEP